MKEPYSELAEKSVLGGILIDADAMARVRHILDPEDFYLDAHKEIYRAMVSIDTIVDLVTLIGYLRDFGRLDKIGGAGYLSDLADSCVSSANIEQHAQIIKEKAALRKIVEGAREIAVEATKPGAKPDQIPTRLSIEMPRNAEVNHVTSTIKQLNKNIEAGYPGLYPCYGLLAKTIRKISPGHLWVCGAYTSVGKSAFLVDLICRLYRKSMDNPGIAVFSTEMSAEQYLIRMLSNQTLLPGWAITENKVHGDQAAALIKAQTFFSERNLYLYDKLYRIEDIERTARMLKEKGLDIIAIDYIQNLWGEGSIYERMSRLSPVLHYLAKELQITVIALSQVSNQFQREKGAGGVFGYKGAGEIAASADLGIELERDKEVKERMIFKVVKNRHGRIGDGVLEYVHGFVKFHEVAEEIPDYGG